jgi:hypothetical protein
MQIEPFKILGTAIGRLELQNSILIDGEVHKRAYKKREKRNENLFQYEMIIFLYDNIIAVIVYELFFLAHWQLEKRGNGKSERKVGTDGDLRA